MPMSTTTERPTGSATSTRERILDIALELFTEQGYDKTSLRDIAERLGTTKAALYYHFKSKSDILLELHLRLHALGQGVLDDLSALETGPEKAAAWPHLLDRFIAEVAANRPLMQLHQRNQSAVEALHDSERHRAANDDIEEQFRRLLRSRDIPKETRVRMACSIGAVMAGLLTAQMFDDIPDHELTGLVRSTVLEMFGEA
jgi:AcrR family transcriptional regulator